MPQSYDIQKNEKYKLCPKCNGEFEEIFGYSYDGIDGYNKFECLNCNIHYRGDLSEYFILDIFPSNEYGRNVRRGGICLFSIRWFMIESYSEIWVEGKYFTATPLLPFDITIEQIKKLMVLK